MKFKSFSFLLFLTVYQSVVAQTSEDFVKDVLQFNNPEWFQSLAAPGKKNYKPQSTDSVLIEFANKVDRRKIIYQTVQYTGEFRNGLFHGKGKLLLKQFTYPFTDAQPGVFTYEGDFESGEASGNSFLHYSLWYTPRDMKPILVNINYQAVFRNGLLVSGLVRFDHTLNDVVVLSAHYNGGLLMKNWFPVLHGLGLLYIIKGSPGSEMAKRSPGIDGGLYAGQFYYGEYTGFAVCNYLNMTEAEMSPLLVGIVGKGELLHTFSALPVKKEWTYKELLPAQSPSPHFQKLFGDYRDVKRGVIYLDKENKYTGGIKNELPHGIGYIENGNGFYDIAFWNAGKRLSVKEVLGGLLGDVSMLDMKRFARNVTETYTSNKGTRQENKILMADYFGSVNQNGNPEGWGIFIRKNDFSPAFPQSYDSTSYEMGGAVIGNFSGGGLPDKFEEAKILALIKEEDKEESFVVGVRNNDWYRSYVFVPGSTSIINSVRWVNEYYSYARPTIGAIETESFKNDIDNYLHNKFETGQYLSNRKQIYIKQVNLSAVSGSSYVETFSGEKIYLEELTADKVHYGDFILYKDVFYEVNSATMLNDYIGPNATFPHLSVSDAFKEQSGYVLKGYWIAAKYETDPENICPYCHGQSPGKSTYTGVGYTGRSETNVYDNNSGGVNIVTKPITVITSVTVDNKPCKYCKGEERRRRVKVNVVRN